MENRVEVLPPVNPGLANGVLTQVDNLINWQNNASKSAEKAGIRLARFIGEISLNQYWIVRSYDSEADYIKATFPQSQSQYFIMRRVGITLKDYPIELLEEIGISKCQDLVRLHRYCNGVIDPNWFVWAKTEKRDEFRRRVQAFLGKALPAAHTEEDWMLVLKIWPDSIQMVQRAFEIAALYAGTDKSNSHLFVNFMCPDWLSGNDEDGASRVNDVAFNLMMIHRFILNLKPAINKDPSVIDRLIGKFRAAMEELKKP
jgi:hypothetical protein